MCLRRLVGLPLSFVWTGAGWYSIFGNGNLFLFPVCNVWKQKTCFLETGFRFRGLLGLETEKLMIVATALALTPHMLSHTSPPYTS
jgi:hypothetical protein